MMFAHRYEPTLQALSESADSTVRETVMQSDYYKIAELKLDKDYVQSAQLRLKYNEVKLYDDWLFPAMKPSLEEHFLSTESFDLNKRFKV